MVEGALHPRDNRRHRAAYIAHDVVCRNPQDRETSRRQCMVSLFVMLSGGSSLMRPPVDLDDETRFQAQEVDDVGINGMLATKLKPAGPLSKLLP
jgi:hypothetical protein